MAGTSKNQRVSRKPITGPYVEQGDSTRIVPLGAGHCYLRDPRNGRTYHVKTNSERFRELLIEIAADTVQGAKLDKEIASLAANAARFGSEWVDALGWYRRRNDETGTAADAVEAAPAN